jgi:hypothetical protein
VGRVAVQGSWFGAQKFEPVERVPYREAWAKLLARVYDVDGQACPRCPGRLRPFGAVLPPNAAEWVRRSQLCGGEHRPAVASGESALPELSGCVQRPDFQSERAREGEVCRAVEELAVHCSVGPLPPAAAT